MSLITISGRLGCGKMKVAKLVSDELNVELYDDQKLQENAIRLGIREEDLKNMDIGALGFLDRLLSRKPKAYMDLLQAASLEMARKGEGVIVGHVSQMFLSTFGCALHAKIHASDPFRIQYMIDRHGMSKNTAEKLIHKTDKKRRGFSKYAFGIDWNDFTRYDLVINRDKLSVDLATKFIVEAGKSKDVKACNKTVVEEMEKISLVKKIEAALQENNVHVHYLNIEVYDKGVVQISGWTNHRHTKDLIIEIAKKVPGVAEVDHDLIVSLSL